MDTSWGVARRTFGAAIITIGLCAAGAAAAQEGPRFEIYGFAQADFIQDFNRVHPAWDATLRPSRIPTESGIYGDDGQSVISVRQSRLGAQANQNVAGKDLFAKVEFDFYGVGVDEGQTTFRLRHAYGQWGPILAGQTHSVFMDIDTFPNMIDYWGPPGMVFLRNPQIRYAYKNGAHGLAVALEKPGNDVDPGNVRIFTSAIGATIQGSEKLPDLTGHYRYDGGWGHVQIAAILRNVGFETIGTANNEPKNAKMGWGLNASSNLKVGEKNVIHLAAVYGEGIASYMNDGGMDLGPDIAPNPNAPNPLGLRADVVPLLGLTAYYDHYWSDTLSSSIGWSVTKVDNTSFQEPEAFQTGQYASANLLYTPDKRVMMGAEVLWGEREDNDGDIGDDLRLQVSFKYSFTSTDFFN